MKQVRERLPEQDQAAAPQRRSAKQQRGQPFRPGQSGNPRGRQKGVPNRATQEVREIARAIVDDAEYRRSLLTRIRKGKLAPAVESLLWHYVYGKPKETVAHEGGIELRWLEPGEDPNAPEGDA
jgi:hypothetical protein